MLMNDDPLVIDLAQADRQTEIQLDILTAGFPPGALHCSGDESHITTNDDVHLLYVKDHRVVRPLEE